MYKSYGFPALIGLPRAGGCHGCQRCRRHPMHGDLLNRAQGCGRSAGPSARVTSNATGAPSAPRRPGQGLPGSMLAAPPLPDPKPPQPSPPQGGAYLGLLCKQPRPLALAAPPPAKLQPNAKFRPAPAPQAPATNRFSKPVPTPTPPCGPACLAELRLRLGREPPLARG